MSQGMVITPATPGGSPVVVIGRVQSDDGKIRFRVHVPVVQVNKIRKMLRMEDVEKPEQVVSYVNTLDITIELDEVTATGKAFRHTIKTKMKYAGLFGALQKSIENGVSGIIEKRFGELCDEADKGGTLIHGKED